MKDKQETLEEAADIERIAMDKLKNKWGHLYTFGYPQRPFPTNYENDLNNIKIGLYEGAKWQAERIFSPSYFIYNSYKVRRQGFKEDAKWQQERMYSEEEVLQIVTNAFNQGERYGWDTQKSIENIDEMRNKIPFMSLEKYLEQYKKK